MNLNIPCGFPYGSYCTIRRYYVTDIKHTFYINLHKTSHFLCHIIPKVGIFSELSSHGDGWLEQETPIIAGIFAIIIILMCETKCHSPEELDIWQTEALISCRNPYWVFPWEERWIPTPSLLQMSEIWENPANLYSHQPIKIKIWAQAQQKQCQRGLSTVIFPPFALSWAVTWLAKLLVISISREVNSNH